MLLGVTKKYYGAHAWLALSYALTIILCYWCYYVTKSVLVVLLDGVMVLQKYYHDVMVRMPG